MTDTTTAASPTEVKLIRVKDNADRAAYTTADGRFAIYRPESGSMTDGWGIEDTQRWTWHRGSRPSDPAIIVDHDYFAQQSSLADCKKTIANIYERGDDLRQTYRVYMTEDEARAAGHAYIEEVRLDLIARQRAKAEAERTPTAGPMTIRRLSIGMGTHKIEDANGDEVARAGKVGDARVMAVASEMLALLEEMDAGLWFGPDSPQASRVHDLVRRAHGA